MNRGVTMRRSGAGVAMTRKPAVWGLAMASVSALGLMAFMGPAAAQDSAGPGFVITISPPNDSAPPARSAAVPPPPKVAQPSVPAAAAAEMAAAETSPPAQENPETAALETDENAITPPEDRLTFTRPGWFWIGHADLTYGHPFKGDSYALGRLAGYAKGMTGSGYLVTTAIDTGEDDLDNLIDGLDEKNPRRVLDRIAPDDVYPTFGDDFDKLCRCADLGQDLRAR